MKPKALILTSFLPNIHPYRGGVEEAFEDIFRDIYDFSEAKEATVLADMTLEELKSYDCLLMYSAPLNYLDQDSKTKANLIDYIVNGGRILVSHFNSPGMVDELAPIAGGRFRMHPAYNHYRVVPTDACHPILEGIEPFEIWDEMHMLHMSPSPNRTVLLHCVNDEGSVSSNYDYPHQDIYGKNGGGLVDFGWCQTFGKGRFVYAAPGHDKNDYKIPMYIKFLQNCAKWLNEKDD